MENRMRWKLVLDEGFECRAESVAVATGRRRDGERKSGSPFGVETISERTPPHHPSYPRSSVRRSLGIIKAYLAARHLFLLRSIRFSRFHEWLPLLSQMLILSVHCEIRSPSRYMIKRRGSACVAFWLPVLLPTYPPAPGCGHH